MRVPFFDPQSDENAYVTVYQEQVREYRIECFDPASGALRWSSHIRNGGYGTPAILGDCLITLSRFTGITGINRGTGEISWQFDSEARVRSSIGIRDGRAYFSSGSRIWSTDVSGDIQLVAKLKGRFPFGKVEFLADGRITTLCARYDRSQKSSMLSIVALDCSGRIRWEADLGPGVIASSDTSGLLVEGDQIYVASEERICRISAESGEEIWRGDLAGPGQRSSCSSDQRHIYVGTMNGYVQCYDKNDGRILWCRYLSDEGIWTPVTVLSDRLAVVAGGVAKFLDLDKGFVLQAIPVGHAPYSACVVTPTGDLLLGGGDPPYFGLLLKLVRGIPKVVTKAEESILRADSDRSITVTVSADEPIDTISLNLSAVGGEDETRPMRRDDTSFVFGLEPTLGRRIGVYALPTTVQFTDGTTMTTTTKISLEATGRLPDRVVLHDVEVEAQQSPSTSGAACIAGVRKLYGDSESRQGELREMADRVLAKAEDYSPFQLWRIVARRLAASQARNWRQLPEFCDDENE